MFKDVMVLLDGADEDEVRLAHAESVAARFAAHLTGLCISPIPEYGLAFAGEPGFVAGHGYPVGGASSNGGGAGSCASQGSLRPDRRPQRSP